jgi:hypothetical protein
MVAALTDLGTAREAIACFDMETLGGLMASMPLQHRCTLLILMP